MRIFGFIALGAAFAGFAFLAVPDTYVSAMASRPPVVGSPAPDFELTDLSGKPVTLSQYQGQVVLLNFWATWCKPCIKEMPAMQQAYDELRDGGLVVLAVNELEDADRVRAHIEEYNHTFPVLMDYDNRVANMYGVVGLPVTVFIDRSGVVQEYVKGGLLTKQMIHQTVARLESNPDGNSVHPTKS